MPTALRIGPYRIYFYSYDCEEPCHMHVDRERMSAKFWLEPDVLLGTIMASRELNFDESNAYCEINRKG